MTYDAAKITKNTKVYAKIWKKYLKMIALTLWKARFKFLNTTAE